MKFFGIETISFFQITDCLFDISPVGVLGQDSADDYLELTISRPPVLRAEILEKKLVYLGQLFRCSHLNQLFKEDYSDYKKQEIFDGYAFVLDISSEETEIEFALEGEHLADEFTIFASPKPSTLIIAEETVCGDDFCDKEKGETYEICPLDCKKPYGAATFWLILIIAAIAAGLFGIWKYYAVSYDKRLREKMFKPKEDFFKLTFFIANEINKGKKGKEIENELEKAGWRKSQIEYGMKKVKERTSAMQRKSILDYVKRELRSGKILI